MKNVKNILDHVVHYWEKENPAKAVLAPPATSENIQSLQRLVGANLPRDYVELLKLHNGYKSGVKDQHRFEIGFFHYSEWEFSPTSDVIESHGMLSSMAKKHDLLTQKNDKVERGIRPVMWDDKWLPIFVDSVGNSICLDFNPSNEGIKGQLILVDYYSGRGGDHKLIASNFLDGLAKVASGLVGSVDGEVPKKEVEKVEQAPAKKPGWLSWGKPKETK